MTTTGYLDQTPLGQIAAEHPPVNDILANLRLDGMGPSLTFSQVIGMVSGEDLEDFGTSTAEVMDEALRAIEMDELDEGSGSGGSNACLDASHVDAANDASAGSSVGAGCLSPQTPATSVESIEVLPGTKKTGEPEAMGFTLHRGQIASIVGPTGSGKSRLLADVECIAQGDTPTNRVVRVNGMGPGSIELDRMPTSQMTAQLSQNMNFVMDLTVRGFLAMHANSLGRVGDESAIQAVFSCANNLAGEKFYWDTPVTQLSGGQSRSLMVADVAILGSAPIVLVDEIENADIDRAGALELLAGEGKVVLMSTHDPVLALKADKRIVVSDGGIADVIETGEGERDQLPFLEHYDTKMLELRDMIRRGKRIDFDVEGFFKG